MKTPSTYCIVKTRHLYGPRVEKARLLIDNGNEYLVLSHAEAVAESKRRNEESSFLGYNEHGPATYSVVKN
jgi:hypothetical protein